MKLLLSLVFLLSSLSTFAQRGGALQVIPLYLDIQTQGHESLKLKQLLKQQHSRIDIEDLDLVSVKIIAKSRNGNGEAVLEVGQRTSYPVTIPGGPYNFASNSLSTYFVKSISNPKINDNGAWQLELKGQIKVLKVELVVERIRRARVQDIYLRMGEQHLQGASTLKIKQLLNQQYPGLELGDAELVKVSMLAKSHSGNGEAVLVVGQSNSFPQYIAGRPVAFRSTAPRSYSMIDLLNTTRDSNGKWQIDFKGNIKVKDIVITIKSAQGTQSVPPVQTRPTRPSRRRG